jgi:serine/threonine protein kinase
MNPAHLAAGTAVGGYVVTRALGQGGMGIVYEAREVATGRPVAIKFVLGGARHALLERFRREGQKGALVSHPNVARVEGSGELAGAFYLVFELLPGGSLDDLVRSRGKLPWREVARLGAQVARGLQAIHAEGIVHRDMKPANVLLDAEGVPKVSDFGLARSVAGGSIALTKTGEMLGTLEFMAPEQADGKKEIDGRADLYALGGTLFALLAGRPPFQGSGMFLLTQHLHTPPPPVRSVVKDVPERFERLLLKLLAKEPGERGTDEEAIAELDALASGKIGVASRRWLAVAAALVVLAVGIGLAWAWKASASPSPPPPPPPSPANHDPELARSPIDRKLLRSSEGRPCTPGLFVTPIFSGTPRNHRDHVTRAFVTRTREVVSVGLDGLIILGDRPDPNTSRGRYGKRVRRAGSGPVHALARSPDESRVVTGADDGTLRIFSLKDDDLVAAPEPLFQGRDAILCAVFVTDTRVAWGDAAGTIKVLDLDRPGVTTLAATHAGPVTWLARFHKLRRFVSGGADGAVLEWDGDDTSKAPVKLGETGTVIASVALSEDDRFVLVASERTLEGRDTSVLQVIDREPGSGPAPPPRVKTAQDVVHHGADFLRGTEVVVTADDDGAIRAWTLATGAVYQGESMKPRIETHTATARTVDASAELLVSTGDDDYVRLVEREGWYGFGSYGGRGAVIRLEVSFDGREVLVARKSGRIDLVDPAHPREAEEKSDSFWINSRRHDTAASFPGQVKTFEGCVLTGHVDGRIRVWARDSEAESLRSPIYELDTRPDPVASIAVLGNTVVAGRASGKLSVFRPDEVTLSRYAQDPQGTNVVSPARSLDGPGEGEVACLAFLPSGLLAAGGRDGVLVQSLEGDRRSVASKTPCTALAALGTDGDALLVGHEDGSIELWKPGGSAPTKFLGHDGPVLALAPIAGRFASASRDGTVRVWDVRTKAVLEFLDLATDDLMTTETPTALASSGSRLYVGTDAGSVFELDLKSGGR